MLRKLLNFVPYYVYFVLNLPRLLLLSPLSFNGRQIIRTTAVKLGFDRRHLGVKTADQYPLKTITASQFDGLSFDVSLHYPNGYDGSVSTYELLILNGIIRRLRPTLLIEFGTFEGRTALNFAANAPSGAELVTIDYGKMPRVFENTPQAAMITCIQIDSTKCDVTPYKRRAGFVFVDGGHDAPIATSDSLKALEVVAPGGVVVWHDYKWFKGVQDALDVVIEKYGRDNFCFIADTSMVIYLDPSRTEQLISNSGP